MPRCPRCPDVWAKRKHPGRPDTKPDGLHPGCLDIWASGLLPSLHPGIRLLASSGQGQTSGSSWRAWTPARIQAHLGEPRRGLNGPIRASGLAWFVWPETPGCTVMAILCNHFYFYFFAFFWPRSPRSRLKQGVRSHPGVHRGHNNSHVGAPATYMARGCNRDGAGARVWWDGGWWG